MFNVSGIESIPLFYLMYFHNGLIFNLRETNEFVKRQKVKAANSANVPNPNSTLQGLEEHFEPIRRGADKDQFGYQDRIFSKWACAMHTSTNGTIWYDCKQVKFCNNCGEKVENFF